MAKQWFIEQSPLKDDFFVYNIKTKSFLGVDYKVKEYVMYTTSDGKNDFDWIKTFSYKEAQQLVQGDE